MDLKSDLFKSLDRLADEHTYLRPILQLSVEEISKSTETGKSWDALLQSRSSNATCRLYDMKGPLREQWMLQNMQQIRWKTSIVVKDVQDLQLVALGCTWK